MASDLHRPHVFVSDKSEPGRSSSTPVTGLSEEIDRNVRAALVVLVSWNRRWSG